MSTELTTGKTGIGFFQRPEGKVGAIIPIVAGSAIIYFFGSAIGDFVVNAVDNMFHLAIVGGALTLMGWLVFDTNFRTACSFLYLALLRMVFSFDPLGNLKSIRTRFKQRLETFAKSLGELRGQRVKTNNSYQTAIKTKEKELSMLAIAQKNGKQYQIQLASNNVQRAQETIDNDKNQLALYDLLIERLNRGYELCNFKIEDMGQEINHREKQIQDAKISRSIVSSAMGILRGNGMEEEIWDSSNRAIENDYAMALGEVDNLLDLSKGLFEKQELLQEANVYAAMKQLDEWNNRNVGVMSGNVGGARQLPAASAATITLGKPNYEKVPAINNNNSADDEYGSMFNNKK